jgi:hypothetical protein
VFRPQPNLEVCERAIPIKYLNNESKGEAKEMKNLDDLIFNSPKRTEEEEENPKKMDQDHTICKNLINHFSPVRRREAPSFKTE